MVVLFNWLALAWLGSFGPFWVWVAVLVSVTHRQSSVLDKSKIKKIFMPEGLTYVRTHHEELGTLKTCGKHY